MSEPESASEPVSEPAAPPQEFSKLRDLIVESRDRMPKRLAQVAAFTIEFPDDIAFGTVGRISEQARVQPSTLVRFAQALGYSGFSELQTVFQQRLRDRPSNYDARLQAVDAHTGGMSPAMALIDGFSDAALRSVERLRERIQLETLEQAAKILAGAETLYLIGQRRAYPVTSYLSYVFATMGVRAVLVGSPNGIDRELLSFAGPRDAAGIPGPYEAALQGIRLADPKQPLEILRTVHSFDPCLACAVHLIDPNGEELLQVRVQ